MSSSPARQTTPHPMGVWFCLACGTEWHGAGQPHPTWQCACTAIAAANARALATQQPSHTMSTPQQMCRFNDHAPATVRVALQTGCVCYPNDREQLLCEHHWYKAEPLGDMVVVEELC